MPTMDIKSTLFKIGSEYNHAKLEQFSAHELGHFVRQAAPHNFETVLHLSSTNVIIKGSVGQSTWSDVPWIAFLDELVTDSTLRGYYLVYLFSADGKKVYLAMGQGVTSVKEEFGKDWRKVLHQRANLIRTRLPEYKTLFNDEPFDLKGQSDLSKAYSEAPAFYKEYEIDSLPSNDLLLSDLETMLALYSKLTFLGGTDLIESVNADEEKEINLSLTERNSDFT